MVLGDSLSINNVTKSYKNCLALDQVNLSVRKGEFLTILGPSGSGKTTLLKLIAGFEDVTSGEILLDSQDISKMKAYERGFGMMFQNYALFPHMTVYENVAYPLKLRKMSKKEIEIKVEEILNLVKLEDYSKRYPKQLSGGQQQRVALARAIVFNPPILLLDEPLGALDKNLRQQMQYEIKSIQKKVGITTISVTHDQEEALTMSDRICIMNNGRIEQVDTPQNIYNKPKNRFVAEFIGEINLLKSELIQMEKDSAIMKIFGDQVISAAKENITEGSSSNQLYLALRPENLQIVHDHSKSHFENTIKATIIETLYVGEAIKVKAQTPNAQEIILKISSQDSGALSIGKEIQLGWNSKEALVVSA